MSYPTYSKQSPTRWRETGNIPSKWEARRLKFAVTLRNVKIEAEGTDLEYMGLEHIESWTGKRIEDEAAASEGIATCFVKDDVLFGKLRPYLAKVFLAEKEGMATTEALVMVSDAVLVPAFLKYLLISDKFINAVSGTAYGAKMPRANWEAIGGLPILLPTRDEQQQIAAFLDWKTGQIDGLIGKKKELLEKLKEKRLAVITQSVTQGLNPAAPLRDSGIPWLGKVPEHWEVKRLKFIFPRLYSGVSVNSDNSPSLDGSVAILKTSCVYGNRFKPDENKRVVENEIERVACPVTGDSLVISRMNTPELVGNCGYVDRDYEYLFLPDRLWIAHFQNHPDTNGKFAWYLVISHALSSLTGILATGTSDSMKNLTQEAFLDIRVGVPPTPEQADIAAFLDAETKKLDALEDKVLAAVEKLNEYRTALITAATTGKIDVSTVKVPTQKGT
jgi:type I restriction enzyme S subunit